MKPKHAAPGSSTPKTSPSTSKPETAPLRVFLPKKPKNLPGESGATQPKVLDLTMIRAQLTLMRKDTLRHLAVIADIEVALGLTEDGALSASPVAAVSKADEARLRMSIAAKKRWAKMRKET